MQDDDEEMTEFVLIDNLSDHDYVEIKKIGIELYKQGVANGDQFKIAVIAFQTWAQALLDDAEKNEATKH